MRIVALLITLIFLSAFLAPSAAAEPHTQTTGYLPSPVLFSLWCSEKEHALVPDEPTEPWPDNPSGWALSGEPECAYAEALNKQREAGGEGRISWGLGLAVHYYDTEDTGSVATAWASDAAFGEDAGYLHVFASADEGTVSAEGCGLQSIVLPEPHHWQSVDPPPPVPWWAHIKELGVDEDLSVCFATTGIIHGTWGA